MMVSAKSPGLRGNGLDGFRGTGDSPLKASSEPRAADARDMQDLVGVGQETSPARGGKSASKAEDVQKAAKDFEALLIEQMLRSAREAGSGDWMGSGSDQTGMPLSEMAEQQFAQMLSGSGGLGLARLVVNGLGQRPEK